METKQGPIREGPILGDILEMKESEDTRVDKKPTPETIPIAPIRKGYN